MTLSVEQLSVSINDRPVLRDLTFALADGERLGVIGGSGSGKTLTALAVQGLLPRGATVSGRILLDGVDVLALDDAELAKLRGDRVGMVFQEPKTALNPLHRLGRQMTESLHLHYRLSRGQRREAAEELARRVGLDDSARMLRSYPHQVSGGQRQRAAIAAAIAANPTLLIADEPTTALDVTVQQGVLRLFLELSETQGQALLFISHDLAVVAEVAERVIVLDRGELVEEGRIEDILATPRHPVTRALIEAADGRPA
ncbi:ABC transporter ATP-binding protein [Leucobacter sp. M11]|uniref:ABC transporter ATP-binding protein n=1 Tax=Leucobacter sp. M11 TaxID=2993565 RepID=UPI002D809FFB|nr:ABC transporter ATP-binding protein [Leucobacter sp. M11]MEB4615556.1 ABC transporter ATP-binding protein [Leucobacter sp. M11]